MLIVKKQIVLKNDLSHIDVRIISSKLNVFLEGGGAIQNSRRIGGNASKTGL